MRLYRSSVSDDPAHLPGLAAEGGPTPGCVVIAWLEFDGPDAQRQHDWIDAVFAAEGSEGVAVPELIGAHFHASTDGAAVVNYAEWISADAHRAFMAGPADAEEEEESPAWQRVHNWPGIKGAEVQRSTLFGGGHR